MRILGIDPGLNITGYGVIEYSRQNGGVQDCKVIEAGIIRNNPNEDMAVKIKEIASGLESIITQYRPEAVAVEELYSHYNHPKTAIIMGHARGVIFLKAAESGLPVYPYAATRIKSILTGNGRAGKTQIQRMIKTSLGLKEIPEPPDVADALGIALCHAFAVAREEVMTS